MPSLDTTQPLDPNDFDFFKGLNAPAADGILSADVLTGLPAGDYRICSINSSTNHQPCLVNIAQHGSLDDCSYVSHWSQSVPFLCVRDALTVPGCSSPSNPVKTVTMVAMTITMVATTITMARRIVTRMVVGNDSANRPGLSSPLRTTYDRLTANAGTSLFMRHPRITKSRTYESMLLRWTFGCNPFRVLWSRLEGNCLI